MEGSLGASWGPKSVPRGLLEGSWGDLGAILAPGPFQEPFRGILRKMGRGSWDPFGSQNPSKFDLKAIQDLIIFCLTFELDFGTHFEPTWSHLGTQNPPKMRPSWVPNRSKLGCCFEIVFLNHVRLIVYEF